jgi:hypothetical protein
VPVCLRAQLHPETCAVTTTGECGARACDIRDADPARVRLHTFRRDVACRSCCAVARAAAAARPDPVLTRLPISRAETMNGPQVNKECGSLGANADIFAHNSLAHGY